MCVCVSECVFTSFPFNSLFIKIMTHSLLLKTGPPFCVLCNKSLPLDHILLYCSDLIDVSERFFQANSLKMLLRDISLDSIFDFLI